MNTLFLHPHLEQGQQHDDREQENRYRAGIALGGIFKGVPVEVHDHALGVGHGHTFRGNHHVDHVENLERGDHGGDDHEEQGGGYHGDRDMEELCCRTGAVDLSSLIIRDNEFFPIIKVMCL